MELHVVKRGLSGETARKEMTDFIKMLESRLDYSWNDTEKMDKLYEGVFELSFMGKKCRFAFGATEYNAVIDMLKEIIEDL